jgi:ribose transport system substrate-binding protein
MTFPTRSLAAVGSALLLGVSVGACGSGSNSAASASASTTANGKSGAASSKFAAAVTNFKRPVTSWPGPGHATKTPPTAKKVVVVTCSSQGIGCVRAAAGATQAGKQLGWMVQTIDGKGDPTVWNSAIASAIADKADGIILAAVPPPLVGDGIAKAKAAGIPIIEVFQAAPVQGSVNVDHTKQGAAMADWVAADSGGKANVILVADTEFKELQERLDGFNSEIAKCSGCNVLTTVNSQIGTMAQRLPQAIVSALQSNPTADYVISPYDSNATFAAEGVRQAGKAGHVKVGGYEGDPQSIEAVRKGQIQAATIADPAEWMGWQAIDELVRNFTKDTVETTQVPWRLITKDNAPSGGKGWLGDFDFESKFKQLWGLAK